MEHRELGARKRAGRFLRNYGRNLYSPLMENVACEVYGRKWAPFVVESATVAEIFQIQAKEPQGFLVFRGSLAQLLARSFRIHFNYTCVNWK